MRKHAITPCGKSASIDARVLKAMKAKIDNGNAHDEEGRDSFASHMLQMINNESLTFCTFKNKSKIITCVSSSFYFIHFYDFNHFFVCRSIRAYLKAIIFI